MLNRLISFACLLVIYAGGSSASAQTAPMSPAEGFAIQTSMATQIDLTSAATAAPTFMLGSRSGSMFFGAGLGVGFASFKVDNNLRLRGRAITVAPALQFDMFSSNDGRVRGGLVASVGIGHLSGVIEDRYWGYDFDAGEEVRRTDRTKASATFLPLRLGLAADYYVHPAVSVGTEVGVRGAVLLSSSTSGGGSANSGFSYQALYGAFRMTFVLGGGGGGDAAQQSSGDAAE